MPAPVPTGEALSKYDERRRAVKEKFNKIGRGARMRASLELGINPSVMYQVTNGRVIDSDTLVAFETWLRDNQAA